MSTTPDAEIIDALRALKQDKNPCEVSVRTSMPRRKQLIRLSHGEDEFLVAETVVGACPADFALPELPAITLTHGDLLRAICAIPMDTPESLAAAFIRHLAERADFLEFQLSEGEDHH